MCDRREHLLHVVDEIPQRDRISMRHGRSDHECHATDADYDDDMDAAPVVVGANWYRFRAGQRIRHERVMSRCVLWALSGTGTIGSRGTTFPMTPGAVLLLPWAHDVDYRADERSPFRLGTVHVVPHHEPGVPVVPVVAHQPGDPMLDDPARSSSDRDSAARPVLVPASTEPARRLAILGGYVVDRFSDGPFDEAVFRALGTVLLAEADRAVSGVLPDPGAGPDDPSQRGSRPEALERMTTFVAKHLDRPLSVQEIADAGGCSPATAERLFARHTGAAVSAWVRSERMREAATLLRTTGLRVGEVAREVGYDDPLYFSRVFRSAFGVPPTRYAEERIRP
jgi:AraC-like DNA-binding protein